MDLDVPSRGTIYIALSFLLWLVVEYVTVWYARFNEWLSLMPYAAIQYLVIVLIFYVFLFRIKWAEKRVFVLMLVIMYIFEFLWQNFLLLDLAWFIPTSVLLVSIWGFLTFIPFWLVNRSIKSHKYQTTFYCLWPLSGFIMALILP